MTELSAWSAAAATDGYSRRKFLRVFTGATAIVLAGPAFLAACGGDDEDESEPTAAGGTSATAATTASATEAASTAVRGGTLTFALATEPTIGGLDPNVSPAAVAHRVMQNIYDTLVIQRPDFSYAPGLASAWEVSDDGLVWTFTLRSDVTFHDGTPFNAEAVKFNFERIKNPDTGSYFATTLLGPFASAEVVDDYTLRATFSAPHAPLLDSLSSAFLGMVSPAAVALHGAEFANNPVGTGPFKFVSWAKQDRIVLAANADYAWGSEVFDHQDAPYVDELIFRIIPEASTRLGAVQTGEVDLAESILPQDLAGLESSDDTFVTSAISPGSPYVLGFNQSKPPFDDENVRKAFIYSLDRAGIVEALYGGTYPLAEGPLSQSTFAYSGASVGQYARDLDQANSLLEAAGWVMGSGSVREKDGTPLEIVILGGDVDREQRHAIEEAIQLQSGEVGFSVQLLRLPAAQFTEARNANQHNITGTSFVSSDPDILRQLYHGSSSQNLPRIAIPELEALLEQGAQTITPEERATIYAEVQKYLMDHGMLAPFYEFPYYVGGRTGVEGVKFDTRAYPVVYDTFKEA